MTAPLIASRSMSAGYHDVAAIHEVDLEVKPGELVLLAGANGAGKTTTVKALAGAISLTRGTVELLGGPTRASMHRRIRGGLGVVTEARTITMGLTVRENLRLGSGPMEAALEHFPELGARLNVRAGLLSGGEQQMLSLARVLAAKPKVILADELSQGLAPIVVKRLLGALRAAADAGAGVLLVEQHVRMALAVVDRAYLIRSGRVRVENTAAELRANPDIVRSAYL